MLVCDQRSGQSDTSVHHPGMSQISTSASIVILNESSELERVLGKTNTIKITSTRMLR